MKLVISVFVGLILLTNITYAINVDINKKEKVVYKELLKKANKKTLYRFRLLDQLIQKSQNKTFLQKLYMTNKFVNRANYLLDKYHWRKKDYWATPYEFISTGAGDSEDFALMKYYVLMLMGIDTSKLKLMNYHKKNRKIVKYRSKIVHDPQHVVLAYFHSKNAKPLILDTIDNKIFKEKNLKTLEEPSRTKSKDFEELFDDPTKCKKL